MRSILMTTPLVIVSMFCLGQGKRISIDLINNTYDDRCLVKTDSLISVHQDALVGFDHFQIKFSEAFFDEANCKLRIIGKSCYRDSLKCDFGWRSVQIFTAKNANGVLLDQVELGETLDTKRISDIGRFDITFCLTKNQSLFFFHPGFYLEEFRLGELIEQNVLRCSTNKSRSKE